MKINDIIGDMKIIEINKNKHTVICSKCGRKKIMSSSSLKRKVGITHKSCSQGYAKKYPKIYQAWNGIVSRTSNIKDKRYKDYGARGITNEFEYFIDFFDCVIESYLEQIKINDSRNITIDRIDNNKGYSKDNIKWSTQKEQSSNRRTSYIIKAISPDGIIYISKGTAMLCEKFNLDRSGIVKVINKKRPHYKNWKFEKMSEMCVEATEKVFIL